MTSPRNDGRVHGEKGDEEGYVLISELGTSEKGGQCARAHPLRIETVGIELSSLTTFELERAGQLRVRNPPPNSVQRPSGQLRVSPH